MTNTIKATTLFQPGETFDDIIDRLVAQASEMPQAVGSLIGRNNFIEFYMGTLNSKQYAEAVWNVGEQSPEAYIAHLDSINGSDPENAHYKADKILLAYVSATAPEIADAYRNVINRSEAWWYA